MKTTPLPLVTFSLPGRFERSPETGFLTWVEGSDIHRHNWLLAFQERKGVKIVGLCLPGMSWISNYAFEVNELHDPEMIIVRLRAFGHAGLDFGGGGPVKVWVTTDDLEEAFIQLDLIQKAEVSA